MKTFAPRNEAVTRTPTPSGRGRQLSFIDNRNQFYQFKLLKEGIDRSTPTIQMGLIRRGRRSLTSKIPTRTSRRRRPTFILNIQKGVREIKKTQIKRPFDLAHRLSYRDINARVEEYASQPKKLDKLIRALTIPVRRYGYFPIGYKGYYDFVIKQQNKLDELVRLLNSSPFNLRPGIPSVNRSIGPAPDLHHEGNDPARSLTPQSRKVAKYALDPDPGKSSDFMTSSQQTAVEKSLTHPFL